MKLALTYTASEAQEAARIINLVWEHYPGVKVRKSDRHAPFYHVYLTFPNQKKAHKSGKNLDTLPHL